jgi:hypothetical protein
VLLQLDHHGFVLGNVRWPTKEAKGNYDLIVIHLKKGKLPKEVWPNCAIGRNKKKRALEDVGKSKKEMCRLYMQRRRKIRKTRISLRKGPQQGNVEVISEK